MIWICNPTPSHSATLPLVKLGLPGGIRTLKPTYRLEGDGSFQLSYGQYTCLFGRGGRIRTFECWTQNPEP